MGKIKETLELLKGSNKLVEIRIFQENGVISGYYNNYDILERHIDKYNGKYDVYMTLNSVRDDIVNINNMNIIKKSSICTRDCDIVKRDFIMIDIDVIKNNNTLSDDLHLHAIKKASMIRDDLIKKEGFNENSFCLCDSGNGAHLLLAINEDNTTEVTSVIKKFLNALADNYNDDKTKVDICTSNAARLTRLYYTYNCKGKKTGGECRQSQLLEKIDDLVIINEDFSKIISYVDCHYHDCRGTNTYQSNEEKICNHFDLDQWLSSHNIRVLSKINADYGTIYKLADCPFDTGHDKDSPGSYIIKYHNSGLIYSSCHHEKCKSSDHCNWDYIWNKYEKNKENPNNVIKQVRYKNSQKPSVTVPKKEVVENNKQDIKKNRADMLIDILKSTDVSFFCDKIGNSYIDNGKDVLLVGSKRCKIYLSNLFFNEIGVTINANNISSVETAIEAIASNTVKDVYKRFAYTNGSLFYNLNNGNRDVVKVVKQDGIYKSAISSNADSIKFIHDDSYLEAATPKTDISGKSLKDYFDKYFCNLSGNERIINDVIIIYRFLDFLMQPLVAICGQRGSGKSCLAKMYCMIMNPTISPIIAKPKDVNDLRVSLANNDTVCLDNISTPLSKSEADTLCLAVTGGYSSSRKLFTDSEVSSINLKSSVYCTGIDLPIHTTDLLERSLFIHLERMDHSHRIDEDVLFAELQEDMPYILGHIFHIICNVLTEVENVSNYEKYHIRIVQFEKYGKLIAKGLGYTEDEFIKAVVENNNEANSNLIDNDDFVYILVEFLNEKEFFEGTPTQLFQQLTTYCSEYKISFGSYTSGPSSLIKKIEKYKDVLALAGITFVRRRTNGKRLIKLQYSE